MVLLLAILLMSPSDGKRHAIPDARLITLGPETSFEEQFSYGIRNWPQEFFVAVITIESEPDCSKRGRVTYCSCAARLERLLSNQPKHEPARHFRMHYWYPREGKPKDVRPPSLLPMRGSRLVGFLAPTHSRNTYSPNLLADASPSIVNEIRQAIR